MKRILKAIVHGLAALAALYYQLLVSIHGFSHISVKAGLLTTHFGELVRLDFYQGMLRHVGEGTHFVFGCSFSYRDIRIGNHVRIGQGTTVGLCDIDDDVRIGPHCSLISGPNVHSFERTDVPIRLQKGKLQRITIGRDCWLGAHVVVMADIGEGSVIGAGAVVTKPIPPWSVAVGVPAKVIRSRRPESNPHEVGPGE